MGRGGRELLVGRSKNRDAVARVDEPWDSPKLTPALYYKVERAKRVVGKSQRILQEHADLSDAFPPALQLLLTHASHETALKCGTLARSEMAVVERVSERLILDALSAGRDISQIQAADIRYQRLFEKDGEPGSEVLAEGVRELTWSKVTSDSRLRSSWVQDDLHQRASVGISHVAQNRVIQIVGSLYDELQITHLYTSDRVLKEGNVLHISSSPLGRRDRVREVWVGETVCGENGKWRIASIGQWSTAPTLSLSKCRECSQSQRSLFSWEDNPTLPHWAQTYSRALGQVEDAKRAAEKWKEDLTNDLSHPISCEGMAGAVYRDLVARSDDPFARFASSRRGKKGVNLLRRVSEKKGTQLVRELLTHLETQEMRDGGRISHDSAIFRKLRRMQMWGR